MSKLIQQEQCEQFNKLQKVLDSEEFHSKTIKEIEEYINNNYANIKAITLGDENIYIVPIEEKPIKIVYVEE